MRQASVHPVIEMMSFNKKKSWDKTELNKFEFS